MSTFKTILVPMADASIGQAPLDAAFRLAGGTAGHVIGLHVRLDPAAAVPLVGEGMSGAMVEEMISAAEKQADIRASAARRVFDAVCARHGVKLAAAPVAEVSAEWLDVPGQEEEVVAWRGRLADLVVVGRPGPDGGGTAPMTLNAALMESGRPLLLIPPDLPPTLGKTIAIAWNGSAEAGRAVGCALPLLEKAASVTILSVSEDDRTATATAGELSAYLAWHGITAGCRKLTGPASHAGEALCTECASLGADLLVMGAYTHSRLRQLILGGVTRHIVHHAPLPCQMCH